MKIKLTKSGGLIGKKLEAETDWHFSDEEWQELSASIQAKMASSDKRIKDAFNYTLQIKGDDNTKTPINPALVPEKFREVFKKLFDGLKAKD